MSFLIEPVLCRFLSFYCHSCVSRLEIKQISIPIWKPFWFLFPISFVIIIVNAAFAVSISLSCAKRASLKASWWTFISHICQNRSQVFFGHLHRISGQVNDYDIKSYGTQTSGETTCIKQSNKNLDPPPARQLKLDSTYENRPWRENLDSWILTKGSIDSRFQGPVHSSPEAA